MILVEKFKTKPVYYEKVVVTEENAQELALWLDAESMNIFWEAGVLKSIDIHLKSTRIRVKPGDHVYRSDDEEDVSVVVIEPSNPKLWGKKFLKSLKRA